MENLSSIKLLATNDLHFRTRDVCGTQFATNKTVKNMSIFDRTPITCAKNVLDYVTTRQKVVTSNVANVNTPGYKTKDVSFNSVLQAKNDKLRLGLRCTHEKHFKKPLEDTEGVETFYAYSPVNTKDGVNDVDIDKEMLKLGEVQTSFNIFTELLSRKYRSIQGIINGNL